ncbi:MAG: ABC transporter substrate-binding protein [Granulosicoccus sp.]
MSTDSYRLKIAFTALLVSLLFGELVQANTDAELEVNIVYLGRAETPPIPLSLLDLPIDDEGVRGAELGLNDNQTTGNFLGHKYSLDSVIAGEEDSIVDTLAPAINAGSELVIADLTAPDLLLVADAYPEVLFFNVRSEDDQLRNDECRVNVLHVAPSRAMLADGLIQYLAWKRWDELVLVTGRHAADAKFAQALTRSVKRFGLKLVDTKDWTSVPGARQTDSGHHSLQQEVPVFSRFRDHHVVLVADETDEFGEYFSYRTSEPRPVAGTQGLIPSSWHRTQEQWGATQIQRRFIKLADRFMTARDYSSWAAMRSLGEAVTQTKSGSAQKVEDYLLSDKFKLAGFKGVPLTYRSWNGQLRQPVLVVGPRMLVSVSPQDGFLHQVSVLDTLGYDAPDSTCQRFTK